MASVAPITRSAQQQPDRRVRPVVGALEDGTPYFASTGEVVMEGDVVLCHLCGMWFRSVLAHLSRHGWTQDRYRSAFGLQRSQPLEGAATRSRRAAALEHRLAREPELRAGREAGQRRARSGQLAALAAAAGTGRAHSEQRRRTTLATLAAISPQARAAGSRRHADARLKATAQAAASERGFTDIGALVRDRVGRGVSLAGICREVGLHKDWLTRHLAVVDPDAALEARSRSLAPQDVAWLPTVARLGFTDVVSYLVDRHVVHRRTTSFIADEAGMSRTAVTTALRRHGVERTPHVTSRSRCTERATEVAARFGFPDIGSYLVERRTAGLTWRAIAAECGQAPSWVRRRAGHR